MTGEQILTKFNRLLDERLKSGDSIYQPLYKEDFFRLFADAYHNNYFEPSAALQFTAVAIKDQFMSRWLEEETEYNDRKAALLNALLLMWDEWYYAWTGSERKRSSSWVSPHGKGLVARPHAP